MESILLWMKGLPGWLEASVNILLIGLVFGAGFTLVVGVWIGFLITRRRMNAIVELQFFPPKIWFREKDPVVKKEE